MITESRDVLDKFLTSVDDCRALFFHCLSRINKHTDAGIEASFLQFVKSWEAFLEDVTLILLCGKLPLSGDVIEPRFILGDREDVRKIIYNGQSYTDWIKVVNVRKRFKIFFKTNDTGTNRLIDAIDHSQSILSHIRIIRNEIAHSSFSTENEIKSVYKDFDAVKIFNRPADYLKEFSKESITDTNFIFYTKTIDLTAQQIIG